MEKKWSISFILACLLTLFVIKPQSVAAKELSPFQTKMIGNVNFGIYQRLTRRGPACWIGSTRTFRHGNFQASAERKIGKTKYNYVWIDGHRAGWVNQRAFLRNKISVAHGISLVKNPNYDFSTRDAINFATDKSGTVIKPCKVNISEDKITTNEAGLYPVTYSYGKAKAHVTVEIRSDDNEGIVKADKTPQPGARSATSWFKHFKTSGHWGKSFAPETKSHTLKSGEFHLKTYFYQPAILSRSGMHNGLVGPVPEGLAVSRGTAYTTMYSSPHNMRSHIVAYKLNQIPNRYIMQKLRWMSWNKFTRLASHVKVSPYIKTGHGQAFSATKKYLYVIANDHLLKNTLNSEEIMQISKKNLRIKRIWSFKIWNNGANDGRYIHNAVFINDHTFIAEYHRLTDHRFEYWEVTRNGDSWIPKEIGATKGDFMFNNSPVQGMTYDKKRKQIYLAFNDYLFKLNRKGRVLDTGSFHTGREFEGICVNGNHFYAELAQRPELLRQRIK